MVSSSNILILGITGVYLLIVLGVGQYAASRTSTSREDFLMANRSFGTIVLLFALFATNMTAVVMIGAPGLAYATGVSALGFFLGTVLILYPTFMMTIGYRVWMVGKKFGHITPGQIVNHRWNSSYLGLIVMLMFTIWTVPYLLLGIQGGGIVFEALTEGLVPYWLGALIVMVVVGLYVYQGGMRGTGWTNTFQGIVFLVFLLAVFLWIPLRIGGFEAATQAVAAINDGVLLNRGNIPPYQPRAWFSQGIIVAMGVFMFPHLLIRYMTARSIKTLKQTAAIYPIALLLAWVPAVMIGFWGAAQLTDLSNPDFVLPAMVGEFLPVWALGFALVGLLAAIMSSLDGQVLTLSTFFSEDIIREFVDRDVSEEREVLYTRVFLVAIFLVAYVGALLTRDTIIDTATFAFSGYALMFFPIASAFYWKRATEETVVVGLVWGFVLIWAFQLGWLPMSLTFGFLPFVPVAVSQLILMGVVNLVTSVGDTPVAEYENLFEEVW